MAANLTRQLLAFSRNAPVRPRKVKMDVVLEGAAEMVRRLVGEDITVETVLIAPAGFIQVDPSQIEQIVWNLAVNGRDAMPNGGVLRLTTGHGQASIKTTPLENSKGPRFVQLTVSDTGVGMDAETQKRAFEPFFTTKPLGQGTGVGLSTVYGVVEQFGGRIEIESELGVGTRVSIIIPMVEGAKTEVMDVNKDAPKALTSGARAEHILVVEDVANLRSLYEEGLRRSGYCVKTAENGKEALALMAKASEPFDLIVSDAMMPVMGGIELFEKLERSHSGLKRLLISGYAGDRQRWEEASSFGEVLAKPFSINAFTAKVRQVLDGASVHMEWGASNSSKVVWEPGLL